MNLQARKVHVHKHKTYKNYEHTAKHKNNSQQVNIQTAAVWDCTVHSEKPLNGTDMSHFLSLSKMSAFLSAEQELKWLTHQSVISLFLSLEPHTDLWIPWNARDKLFFFVGAICDI